MQRVVTIFILLAALCGTAHSDTVDSPPQLEPFSASYGAKYKGMHLKAKRILEPLDNGHYRISSNAKHLFFGSIKESSEFSLHTGRVQPTNYQMKRRILGVGKKESAAFDWQNKQVTSTYKGDATDIELVGDELDWLGYQLQISLDLMAGKEELHYRIVRRGTIKDYYFEVVGEETIETPMGDINTLRLERVKDPNKRQTTFWMAPQYNYLLVKFHRVENDGDEYSLYLRDVEMSSASLRDKSTGS